METNGFLLENLRQSQPEVLQQILVSYNQRREERTLSPFPGPFTGEEYIKEHEIIWRNLLEKLDSTDYTMSGVMLSDFESALNQIRQKMGKPKDYEHALKLHESNRDIRTIFMKIFNIIFSQTLLNAMIWWLLSTLFVYHGFINLSENETIIAGVKRLGFSTASLSIILTFLSVHTLLLVYSSSKLLKSHSPSEKIFLVFLFSLSILSPSEIILSSVDEGSIFSWYVAAHRPCLGIIGSFWPLIILSKRNKIESCIYSRFRRK